MINSANLSSNGKYISTASSDGTVKLWDLNNGSLLYTLTSIDSADYLALDSTGRYDGTENAKKLLYYVCGDETVDLDQLKH
jgi:WD40 repeat protein